MKKILALTMALVLVLSLGACGKAPAAETKAPTESDVSVTRHGSLSAESASIAAVSSILLFVVAASPPHISISRPP